jgi:hypothetical protein
VVSRDERLPSLTINVFTDSVYPLLLIAVIVGTLGAATFSVSLNAFTAAINRVVQLGG